MKIFLSWSGPRSKFVAETLYDWLPKVIQAVKPWLSANDIEKGARWANEISQKLQDCRFGIICVTPENLDARWLNFEAGALSKVVDASRVCPYLVELEPTDIEGPLAQFQWAKADRQDSLKLLQTINSALEGEALSAAHLEESFETWWDKLEARLQNIPPINTTLPKRENRELLEETLSVVRQMSRDQQRLIDEIDSRKIYEAPLLSLSSAAKDAPALGSYVVSTASVKGQPQLVRTWVDTIKREKCPNCDNMTLLLYPEAPGVFFGKCLSCGHSGLYQTKDGGAIKAGMEDLEK